MERTHATTCRSTTDGAPRRVRAAAAAGLLAALAAFTGCAGPFPMRIVMDRGAEKVTATFLWFRCENARSAEEAMARMDEEWARSAYVFLDGFLNAHVLGRGAAPDYPQVDGIMQASFGDQTEAYARVASLTVPHDAWREFRDIGLVQNQDYCFVTWVKPHEKARFDFGALLWYRGDPTAARARLEYHIVWPLCPTRGGPPENAKKNGVQIRFREDGVVEFGAFPARK